MPVNVASKSLAPAPNLLDALLSPEDSNFKHTDALSNSLARISIAESEFNDVALDEESTFSPVALSSNHSVAGDSDSGSHDDTTAVDLTPSVAASGLQSFSHKKTVSMTTIRSPRNSIVIEGNEDKDKRQSNRMSLDGQMKLQEELARLQKADEDANEEGGGHIAIDWGGVQHAISGCGECL